MNTRVLPPQSRCLPSTTPRGRISCSILLWLLLGLGLVPAMGETAMYREVLPSTAGGSALIRAIKPGEEGAMYVAGEATGPVQFDSRVGLAAGATEHYGFIAKVDASSRWIWAHKSSAFGPNSTINCLAVRDEAAYLGGYRTEGDAAKGIDRGLVEKFDLKTRTFVWNQRLEPVWHHSFQPEPESKVHSLAITSDGSLYVGGTFTSGFQVGPAKVICTEVEAQGALSLNQTQLNWNLFVLRVKPDGTGLWGMPGGAAQAPANNRPVSDCAITALTVDAGDNLYAAGFMRGVNDYSGTRYPMHVYSASLRSYKGYTGRLMVGVDPWAPRVDDYRNMRQPYFVAKILPHGDWEYFRPHGIDTTLQNVPDPAFDMSNPDVYEVEGEPGRFWPTAIVSEEGRLYVSGFKGMFLAEEQAHTYVEVKPGRDLRDIARDSATKSGFISGFRADTGVYEDGICAVFRDRLGLNNPAYRYQAVLDLVSDREGMVALGLCRTYVGAWNGVLTPEGLKANPAKEMRSVDPTFFCARLDRDLRPAWIRGPAAPTSFRAPVGLNPVSMAWEPSQERIWFAGSFGGTGSPARPLVLGDSSSIVSLEDRGRGRQSFLTALDTEGRYFSMVQFIVRSAFGPVFVNGDSVLGEVGGSWTNILVAGTDVTVEAPPAIYVGWYPNKTRVFPKAGWTGGLDLGDRAAAETSGATRHSLVGFEVTDNQGTGAESRYVLRLARDSTMAYRWRTDHAFVVENEVESIGVANSNLGDPVPAVGKHWIADGTRTDAFVDGTVLDPDTSRYGTRYVPFQILKAGVIGAADGGEILASLNNDLSVKRLQVGQFQVTGPARLGYLWKKQYRLEVSVSLHEASRLPIIKDVNGNNAIGGNAMQSIGEFWFDANAHLRIGAQATGELRQLSGWESASGVFPSVSGSVSQMLQASTSGGSYYYFDVASFDRPSRVLWKYDNEIFRRVVSLGGRLDLGPLAADLGSRSQDRVTLLAESEPTNPIVITGPPGATGSTMGTWDKVAHRWVPLQPGIVQLEWAREGSGAPVVVQVVSGFHGDSVPKSRTVDPDQLFGEPFPTGPDAWRYRHLAGTPPVVLDPSATDTRAFKELKYAEADGAVTSGAFTAARAGRSVLLFSESTSANVAATGDLNRETLSVRVVDTRVWDGETDGEGRVRRTRDWKIPWSGRLEEAAFSLPAFDESRVVELGGADALSDQTVAAVADFDGDGRLDVVTAGAAQPVRLFTRGDWANPAVLAGGSRSVRSLVAGDLNGDGRADLVLGGVNSLGEGRAWVYSNQGTGAPFPGAPSQEIQVPFPVFAVTLVQFSENQWPDLVVGGGPFGPVPGANDPGLYRYGNPGGRVGQPVVFSEVTDLSPHLEPNRGRVYRLGAGRLQDRTFLSSWQALVVGQLGGLSTLDRLIIGSPATGGVVNTYYPELIGLGTLDLAVDDLNGNGYLDLLAVQGSAAEVTAFRFEPTLSQVSCPVPSDVIHALGPSPDGRRRYLAWKSGLGLASILTWSDAPTPALSRVDGAGTFALARKPVAVGDVNGDGYPDLVGAGSGTDRARLYLHVSDSLLARGPVAAAVGRRLASDQDTAKLETGYVLPGLRSNALYNATLHPPRGVSGPIIPVNRRVDSEHFDELVVAWYEKRDGLLWPYMPVRHDPQWPVDSGTPGSKPRRIVIASRLGSEGLDAAGKPQMEFDTELFDEVRIYAQPDPAQPGYNPNEEHARIYPSFLASGSGRTFPAAFALRDDLNVTASLTTGPSPAFRASEYTSDPYVLVQYRNRTNGVYQMEAYLVQREDGNVVDERLAHVPSADASKRYQFKYRVTAGEQIPAPYPLNLVIGIAPCRNSVEPAHLFEVEDPLSSTPSYLLPTGTYYRDGGTQRAYWLDHKGEGWCVSGGPEARIEAHYFYQLQPDFWYPNRREYDQAAVGECVPWLPSSNPLVSGPPRREGYFAADARDRFHPTLVSFSSGWPAVTPVLKVGETLTFAGGEQKADDSSAPGLPGVVGWAAGEVVFDTLNPDAGRRVGQATKFTAWVVSPLTERVVPLPRTKLPSRFDPANGKITVVGTEYRFNELPASLQKRVFYDPFRRLDRNDEPGVLGIRGYLNDRTLGDADLLSAPPPVYVLEPNVLTRYERDYLLGTSKDAQDRDDSPFRDDLQSHSGWQDAVKRLFTVARNPGGLTWGGSAPVNDFLPGLEPARSDVAPPEVPGDPTLGMPLRALGPGLAVIPNPAYLAADSALPAVSYVTLAENNAESLGAAPVALHVIRVEKNNRYRGAIKTIAPVNVFDEKLTLRHTADFGGNVDDIAFSWWYREEDGSWRTGGTMPPLGSGWAAYASAEGVRGLHQIDLQGANPLLLADNLFFVRYRHATDPGAPPVWSDWAGAANSTPREIAPGVRGYVPQLATGWVKRVLNRLTPYEARFNDFRNHESPATYASLIRQAGTPTRGDVALNADKNVIENTGLLDIYRTVVNRARALSIGATQPTSTAGIHAALMLGSTRLAQLYRLLGDEAVNDAFDPTIGFGTASTEYGRLAPVVFAFQNQVGSLLHEELALLRGLDEDRAWPVHNRLSWNFTKAEGEAAYAMNYAMSDANQDGFINEQDGRLLHPQGHGDAWGHYLSALRTQYELLRHPKFVWQTRAELLNQLDVVFAADYLDERKFAELAAARAAAGVEIVALTFRSLYTEEPSGQARGYTDRDANRGWGVMEWARRAGQGAYIDWVAANAMLPELDTNNLSSASGRETASGIRRLDRRTVSEIGALSTSLATIQTTYDTANGRLNPLGLDPDVVPFDLDPTFVDVGSTAQIGRPAVQGLTHFEQIYERAYAAVDNATVAFDYATEQQLQLRRVARGEEDRLRQAVAQDNEYRNRLIEIFGTPYTGAIGAGKPYPAGYQGPDLSLWMYVDVRELSNDTVPLPSATYAGRLTAFKTDLRNVASGWTNLVESRFLSSADASLASWTNVMAADESVTLPKDRVVELRLPATAKTYTYQAPSEWGERAAPGRLQQILSDLVQIEAEIALAVGDYDVLINQIENRTRMLVEATALAEDRAEIKERLAITLTAINAAQVSLETLAGALADDGKALKGFTEAISAAYSVIVGPSSTPAKPGETPTKVASVASEKLFAAGALLLSSRAKGLELSKEVIPLFEELKLDKLEMDKEVLERLNELRELFINEGTSRIAIFRSKEQLRQKAEEFRAALAEGNRLISERTTLNEQMAAATQQDRYADALLRTSRSEALSRYRAAFELAARYTYLAARAYDYETNFDPNDRHSPRPLLSRIPMERTLGQMLDGKPQHRGGLAGILAALYENFRVVEGQLGFNAPQLEFNRFSFRREALELRVDDPGALDPTSRDQDESKTDWENRLAKEAGYADYKEWTSDWSGKLATWRTYLGSKRVNDLREVPEFRRLCRPFAPSGGGREPGLVIPFQTKVAAGYNFFGKALAPGDSSYDPSAFATKIRSLRINLIGYDTSRLARTPRVYLLPVGQDVMYEPGGRDLTPVYWNVVEQRIPVPVQTGPSDFAKTYWLPAVDGLAGTAGEIARFSSFRAYLEDGDPDFMARDTRLVCRSVWNTRWLLIIPGRSLLSDADQGLDALQDSVTDIQFAFETYGNSGN